MTDLNLLFVQRGRTATNGSLQTPTQAQQANLAFAGKLAERQRAATPCGCAPGHKVSPTPHKNIACYVDDKAVANIDVCKPACTLCLAEAGFLVHVRRHGRARETSFHFVAHKTCGVPYRLEMEIGSRIRLES